MHRLWRLRARLPGEAIFAEDETPEQWKNYIELNKQFFKDNPGVKPTTKK